MEVIEAFKSSVNKFGLVTPRGAVTQNDVLFSAFYVAALLQNGVQIPDPEMVRLVKALRDYQREDGSTKRTPESDELDSHDNLTGWAYLSYHLYPGWAQKILSYARANAWVWPGVEPESQRWLGRHRHIEPVLQIAAGERPDVISQLTWTINAIASAFASKANQDSYNLNRLMVSMVLDRSRFSGYPLIMALGAVFWSVAMSVRGWTWDENLMGYGWGGTPYVKFLR